MAIRRLRAFAFGALVTTICACTGGAAPDSPAVAAQPTPIIIYVTAEPTATARPTSTPRPTPTPKPTPTPTATPKPTPTPKPLTFAQKYKLATKVAYDELFRNSEKYMFLTIGFKGEVIQVLDGGDGRFDLRINVTKGDYGFWDDTVYVVYEGKRFLEDDIVYFIATYTGPITYESTMGASITIPGFILGDAELALAKN